jgi:lipopolysaccharide/colanic/teichoic acid biosynthesis glycosyltransferase
MYPIIKRVFDFTVACMAIALLSPLLLFIAIRIKSFDGGSVLYAGHRVGKAGKPFRMYKFRSMVLDADRIGGSSTPDDDPRVTPIGRFLRRSKLDELPQLLNVVRGEMSLVGPRPQVQWAVDLYTPEQRIVLDVLPGITDYASVRFPNEGEILKGSSDPDRDYMERIHPEKMRLSLEYVRNRSMLTDLKVLAQTATAIIR